MRHYITHRDRVEEASYDIFDFVSLVRSSLSAHGESLATGSKLYVHELVCMLHNSRPRSMFPDRRTLCLDMDDTLTFMTFNRVKDVSSGELRDYDTIVTAQENPNDWGLVYFRPYLKSFLEAVSKVYEVVVLTAACSEYADQILDCIDPEHRLIHHRLYRESCQECTPNPEMPDAKVYIKDLRVLGRPLNQVILIDNSLLCFAYQLDNGIVCNPYKGSSDDRELLCLLQVLSCLNNFPGMDVRKFFRKMYGLANIIDEYTKHGARSGIRKVPSDQKEQDFLSPERSNAFSPAKKTTPTTRYPRSGLRTSDRHTFSPESEGEEAIAVKASGASPIFINTILPRFEPTSTPIESLYQSILHNRSSYIYRG